MSQRVYGADNVGTGKASGEWSHAEGSGTATGVNSHAEGNATTASGNYAHAEGQGTASGAAAHAEGSGSASGTYAHAEGNNTSASATSAHAEGTSTAASGQYSHAEGLNAVASRLGQYGKSTAAFTAPGDAQYSHYVLAKATTDATPTPLTSGGGAVTTTSATGTINVVTVPASRAVFFRAEVMARRNDVTGEAAAFTITGALSRDATGAPRLVGSPTTVSWADAGAAAWTVAASIVTVAGPIYYLALTATGEAAKAIRWCATLHTTEIG